MYENKEERNAHRKDMNKLLIQMAKDKATRMVHALTINHGISSEVLSFEHEIINEMHYFAINTKVENERMSRYHLIAFDCPLSSLKFHDSNVSDLNKGATIEKCVKKYSLYITNTFKKINPL